LRTWRPAGLVLRNDLRRRLRDRSALVTAFGAPLALSVVLGLAFHGGGGTLRFAVAEAPGMDAASALAGIRDVAGTSARVTVVASAADVRAKVSAGKDDLGVIFAGGAVAPSIIVRGDQPLGSSVAGALQNALTERAHTASTTITVVDQTVPGNRGLIGYFGPSMGIVFLFFVASIGARGFLEEREIGTMARLRASPVPAVALVIGKVLGMLALGLASMTVLWTATVHLFATSWGSPLPVALAIIATTLAMTGIGAVVTIFSRTTQQAAGVSGIVGFVLGLLGGNFFPPGSLPPFLVTASKITPNRWALQTFGSLALDHGTLSDVWPALVVLVMMGALTGGYALRRVQRMGTV
jgi:ABC-2 type transport system permease protein